MSASTACLILAAVLGTACLSGIFGMAGGLVLMGVLTALLPVATAMVVHGCVQLVSNGYRAYLWRAHIDWRGFRLYLLGSLVSLALLFALSWRPDSRWVYLALGSIAMLVWVPRRWVDLDFQRPGQAVLAGLLVQALNTVAGVAGPLLDLFFVRTAMTRHEIVATKAVTQTLAHLVKIAFWSAPLIANAGFAALPDWRLLAAAVPLSMLGTFIGGLVLERLSDVNFKRWMKGLVTAIGVVMFVRAFNG